MFYIVILKDFFSLGFGRLYYGIGLFLLFCRFYLRSCVIRFLGLPLSKEKALAFYCILLSILTKTANSCDYI